MADIPIYQRTATAGFHPMPKPSYELLDRSGEQGFARAVGGIAENLFDKIITMQANNEYVTFEGASRARIEQYNNLLNTKPDMPLADMQKELDTAVKDIRFYQSRLKLPAAKQNASNWIAGNLGLIKEQGMNEAYAASTRYGLKLRNAQLDNAVAEGNIERVKYLHEISVKDGLETPELGDALSKRDVMRAENVLEQAKKKTENEEKAAINEIYFQEAMSLSSEERKKYINRIPATDIDETDRNYIKARVLAEEENLDAEIDEGYYQSVLPVKDFDEQIRLINEIPANEITEPRRNAIKSRLSTNKAIDTQKAEIELLDKVADGTLSQGWLELNKTRIPTGSYEQYTLSLLKAQDEQRKFVEKTKDLTNQKARELSFDVMNAQTESQLDEIQSRTDSALLSEKPEISQDLAENINKDIVNKRLAIRELSLGWPTMESIQTHIDKAVRGELPVDMVKQEISRAAPMIGKDLTKGYLKELLDRTKGDDPLKSVTARAYKDAFDKAYDNDLFGDKTEIETILKRQQLIGQANEFFAKERTSEEAQIFLKQQLETGGENRFKLLMQGIVRYPNQFTGIWWPWMKEEWGKKEETLTPQYTKGQLIQRGGKTYKITSLDLDGTPMVEEVK